MSVRSSFVIFAFLCSACASSKAAEKSESAFPTQEEFQKLLAREIPDVEPSVPEETVRADTWTLTGPQPQYIGVVPRAPESLVEEELVAANFELDEATHCIARELGHFHVKHGKFPSSALQEYIEGWCGSIGHYTNARAVDWKVDPRTDRKSAAEVADYFSKRAGLGQTSAVWYDPGLARLIIVTVYRKIDVDPIPLVEETDAFELRGRVIGEHVDRLDGINALVTKGPFGFEHCTRDEDLSYPEFRVRCPTPSHETRLSVSAGIKASKEFGTSVSGAIRFRTLPGLGYRAPALPELEGLSSDATQARSEIVDVLNAVRARANLKPMTLSVEQSELVSAATPHHLAASAQDNYEVLDQLIAGLKAGWHVQGSILDASWITTRFSRTDTRELVEYIVTSPGYRELIYHPDTRAIAIDLQWLDEEKTAVRFFGMGYQFVPDEHYNRTVGRAFARINEVRGQYGRKPVKRLRKFNTDMQELCEGLSAGRFDAEEAFKRLGAVPSSRSNGKSWRYNSISTSNLDRMLISARLAKRETAELALCVATYRNEGAPWVHNKVLMFWFE